MQKFSEQQQMFDFLRNDLRRYKEAFEMAMEAETMYSPLTPTHRLSQDHLESLPKTSEGIVDLREIMKEHQTNLVKTYETRLKDLQAQNKELNA